MIRQEAILQSPLRILDRAIRGGLGKGRLGVIMAPAGVGKSACLVQLGLDALLRGRSVLHVALGQTVQHVSARYDALFDELADRVDLADRGRVREGTRQRRLIWSADEALGPRPLEEALAAFQAHLAHAPSTLLVDGLDGAATGVTALVAMKAAAAAAGAELWLTARDRRGPGHPPGLAALPEDCAALADVALALAPRGRHARLVLVKDLDQLPDAELPVVLEGGTLRLAAAADAADEAAPLAGERDPDDYTLFASGSAGAEEEFGACAERWGVREVNFTFAGRRELARTRGVVELSDDALALGAVSDAYVEAHLHRALSRTPELRRVLQAIWHQVSKAGEVFSVGALNPDGTARGGTGWAVELGRRWGKPVHLFDQERSAWLRWTGQAWLEEPPPVITSARFAGAGTRSLSADGRGAIRGLFERSFGTAPA
jgi:hypothetical protein